MAGSPDAITMAQDMAAATTTQAPGPNPSSSSSAPAVASSSGRHSHNVTVYQTTGPDAYTSPIPASDGSGAPALNPRSCVTCRRRKVRCDKQMPCSNCRRALIPCVFPAPGRAPRQPRPRDPSAPHSGASGPGGIPSKPGSSASTQREAELVKRLKKLEGIVEELSGQIEVEGSAGPKDHPSSSGSPGTPQLIAAYGGGSRAGNGGGNGSVSLASIAGHGHGHHSAGDGTGDDQSPLTRQDDVSTQLGRLVLNDHKGSTRYVTNGFWSKLNDELNSLREDLTRATDQSDDSDYEDGHETSPESIATASSNHQSFIFGYSSHDVDLTSCHPLPAHVTYLWSVYQENVDPLVKVLHIPTMDATMREARKNPASLAPGMQALVFAIYYTAVVSLEPQEVVTNLGESADKLLRQFRFALEQALAKANFLNTSELCIVQTFALFLTAVRRDDDSRFCWTLTGLVIRLAQGMGLHRDGTQFDLTPFETEMRRRVWWVILTLDLRSAEEVGTELTVPDEGFDTQLPLNINDTDISPSSTEFPTPRLGQTDLATTLVRCEIARVSRRLVTDMASREQKLSATQREEMLIDVYRHVESKFLKYTVDESDPLWWVASMVARIIMSKMCLVIYQHDMFPGATVELSGDIRQRLYVASTEVVELGHRLNVDPRAKQYRWLFMTYTNWHAVAFNLLETCRRPWTALVERSWEAVSGFERDPVHVEKAADHAAVFLPMRKLFLRARRHRELELARLRANIPEARRLDFQERMNPAEARFGPLPGYENKMDQVREKWWGLIREGESNNNNNAAAAAAAGLVPTTLTPNTWPRADHGHPSLVNNLAVTGVSPASIPATGSTHAGQAYHPGVTAGVPTTMSDAAMDYLHDFMLRPNTSVAEFLPLNNLLAPDPGAGPGLSPMDGGSHGGSHYGGSDPGVRTNSSTNPLLAQQAGVHTQAGAVQGGGDSHLPPYLWTNAYEDNDPMVTGDGASADMDMGDFDWQNWGQSLQTLDMGGM